MPEAGASNDLPSAMPHIGNGREPDPEGYEPQHLYLLSRHGTRWPTADRMKQINGLDRLFKVRGWLLMHAATIACARSAPSSAVWGAHVHD